MLEDIATSHVFRGKMESTVLMQQDEWHGRHFEVVHEADGTGLPTGRGSMYVTRHLLETMWPGGDCSLFGVALEQFS